MAMQFTPGPWDYFVGNANGRGLIRIEQQGTGVHIASMPRGVVSEANARLIAAAPDLLAALDALLTFDRVERPAFRHKPIGAPGSTARIEQDKLIAIEDAARAAIAMVMP